MLNVLIAFATATSGNAIAPSTLDRAVNDYDVAQQKGDGRALHRLLSDGYILVGSDGTVETKEAFIRDLTSPDYRMNPFTVLQPISRVWPGGAVKGGVALLSGTSGGHAFSACLRFVDVWMFEDGRWQVAYSQAAKEAASDCARGAPMAPKS